jgi:hypothetical protein
VNPAATNNRLSRSVKESRRFKTRRAYWWPVCCRSTCNKQKKVAITTNCAHHIIWASLQASPEQNWLVFRALSQTYQSFGCQLLNRITIIVTRYPKRKPQVASPTTRWQRQEAEDRVGREGRMPFRKRQTRRMMQTRLGKASREAVRLL